MTVKTPPVFIQSGSYVAQDLRQMLQGQAASGVIRPNDFITSAGGGMSVNVAAGSAFVAGTETTTQGTYFVVNDAPVNLVVAASDATNARNDLVVLRVRDALISGAFSDAALVVVTGVAAGSPVDPAVPNNSVILGRLVIPALAASVIAGYITDIRQMAVETWPSQATTGLIGAQAGTRMVGATAGGAPTTGTFAIGDIIVDRAKGRLWMCSAAGTPGSWLLLGNGPGVRATHSGPQAVNNGAYTPLNFDTNTYDSDAMHSTSVNNTRFTAVIAGKYIASASCRWPSNVTGERGIGFRKNGVGMNPDGPHTVIGPDAGGGSGVSVTAHYQLAVGDYLEALCYQSSGGALNTASSEGDPSCSVQWVAN